MGNSADQKAYSVLKDRVREDITELYSLWNLPAKYDPKDFFPSKVELHPQQTFCKNNPLKLYTVLPVLSQSAAIVLKSGCLSKADNELETLVKLLPCREAMLSMIRKLALVYFSALRLLPFNHDIYINLEEEEKITINKNFMQHAVLLRYNVDLSAVQWYYGGKCTIKHRRIDQMLQVMSHILPDKLFQELVAGLVNGVPNLLNTKIPSDEVATLLTTNNLSTVAKKRVGG